VRVGSSHSKYKTNKFLPAKENRSDWTPPTVSGSKLFGCQNFFQQRMIDHLGGGHGLGDLLRLALDIDEELHTVGMNTAQ